MDSKISGEESSEFDEVEPNKQYNVSNKPKEYKYNYREYYVINSCNDPDWGDWNLFNIDCTDVGIDDEEVIQLGEQYKSSEEMQNVFDKLLMLEYENHYLSLTKLPPLHRLYFIVPTNPWEQFFNFVSLSSWLIKICGKKFDMPEESEDPNTVICRILDSVQKMGAILDFPPSSVKSGCGPTCVSILDFLTDKALIKLGHAWEPPFVYSDAISEEMEMEDNTGQWIRLENMPDETQYSSYSEDDDDEFEYKPLDIKLQKEQNKIIRSAVTHSEWELELKKVLPELKVTIQSDNSDWRKRLEKIKVFSDDLSETLSKIDGPITRIISETESVTQTIRKREACLSAEFSGRLDELSQIQSKISEVNNYYEKREQEFKERNRHLAALTDQIDEFRLKLNGFGTLIADGAPVTKTRKEIDLIKMETAEMNIEIAALEHCIFTKPESGRCAINSKHQMDNKGNL